MVELRPIGRSATVAGFVLGRKLDGIPFSAYHAMVIAVLVKEARNRPSLAIVC
jgi:hypothetical protein